MRYVEFTLWLVPVGLVVAWLCGVRGLSRRGLTAAVLLLVGFGLLLLWLGEGRSFVGHYAPARLQGSKIVPGHVR